MKKLKNYILSAIFLFAVTAVLGQTNYSLYFDGTDDFVNVPDNSSLDITSAITIEAWVYYQGGSYPRIAAKANTASTGVSSSNYFLGFDVSNRYPRFAVKTTTSSKDFNTGSAIALNTWTHIAGTYNSSTGNMIIYVNGVAVASTTHSGTILTSAYDLTIGASSIDGSTSAYELEGRIDELRIWNTERTLAQIDDNKDLVLYGNEAGLAAYYKMDDARSGTTVLDHSLNTNNGTLISGTRVATIVPTLTVNNVALNFDQDDDYVSVPDHSTLDITGDLTLEGWVQFYSSPGVDRIVTKAYNSTAVSGCVYFLGFNTRPRFAVRVGGSVTDLTASTGTIEIGDWYHIAGTYNSSTGEMKIYLNGSFLESQTISGGGAINTSNEPVTMAASLYSGTATYELDGYLDEVRIWNVVRTADEIDEFKDKELTGSETGLAAYYPMRNRSGTTVTDESQNTNNGTETGNCLWFSSGVSLTPGVSTTAISDITTNSASSGGTVYDSRSGAVTARGVCWNTGGSPTLSDDYTTDGTGTGVFVSGLTTLSAGQLYYVRSYATNSVGTNYGTEQSFTTLMAANQIVINNNDNGAGSLRQAIADVGVGKEITFDADYTITLSSELTIDKSMTITGRGAGATIIQANASPNTATYRVFNITAGTVTISDMTIRNGKTPDAAWASNAEHGGGIFNTGTLTIEDCTISHNHTGDGGGNSGNFTAAGKGGSGAGLYSTGSLTISRSTFSHNTTGKGGDSGGGMSSMRGQGGNGAGIYTNVTSAAISNSTFSDNTTGSSGIGGSLSNVGGTGACIHHVGGTMTIDECTLSENTSSYCGGGIENWATLSITNSTISGNTGINIGGGISSRSGTLTITNCTMSGNTLTSGSYGGGGMGLYATSATVSNCTFANNSTTGISNNGGGILLYSGTLEIKNTIIANNSSEGTADFHKSDGTLTNNGYNAVETQNGTDFVNGSNGCITGTTCGENLSTTLADNGGATMTLATESGSVAISAGSWDASITTDQRGEDRHQYYPTIGAYEPAYAGYWAGAISANWNTAGNWNDGSVAGSSDDVIIPPLGKNSYPIVNEDPSTPAQCDNLTIISGASLTVNEGKAITVNGDLDNDGTLTISSSSSGTGSLIVNGTVSGDVTAQRYIAGADWGTWNDGWHFISSPVANYDIAASNFVVATAADYDFYAWSEVNNEWINFKTGDVPSFLTVNGSDNFELGRGYMAAYKNADTKDFTGTINVENVEIEGLTNTGGTQDYHSWHLLGNPFNSALTWDNTWTTVNIGANIQIWNEAGSSYTIIANNPGGVIPATNGFMIQGTSTTSASVTIPKSKRVHNATPFYKNADFPIIKLKANNIDNPSFQESQLLFNPESSMEYNPDFDCDFLPGYAPLFYSNIDGRPMGLNSMPDAEETTTIPFTFIKNEGFNFSIEMYEVQNMDMDVWLYDNKLNKDHNLTQSPVYYFTAFENDNNERFAIHFSPLGIDDDVQTTAPTIQTYASSNTLYILNPKQKRGTVTIYNLTGQKVAAFELTGDTKQQQTLVVSDVINIVKVQTDSEVISGKVIMK